MALLAEVFLLMHLEIPTANSAVFLSMRQHIMTLCPQSLSLRDLKLDLQHLPHQVYVCRPQLGPCKNASRMQDIIRNDSTQRTPPTTRRSTKERYITPLYCQTFRSFAHFFLLLLLIVPLIYHRNNASRPIVTPSRPSLGDSNNLPVNLMYIHTYLALSSAVQVSEHGP